ncbi:formyltransferase family protein [Geobacillus vulcani]|uniref:formyltransferase family protein n=1 Tax=Geobacillus vulcani TaxID=135517 RepID=UPI0004DF9D51|nr:formyltransferase family protein [Geobacillus vulcani]
MIYVLGGKLNAAVRALEVFHKMGINPLVYVSPGEDRIRAMSSLEECANKLGSKLIKDIHEIYGEKVFFLSVECDRILNEKFFGEGSKFFNVHFSLLPKYRGTMTSFWPIVFGENETGVTLHEIDNGIDTGDIISQVKMEIREEYTCRDLYFKYHEVAGDLIEKVLPLIVEGKYTKLPQDSEQASSFPRFLYHYFPKDFYSKQLRLLEKRQVYNILRALIFKEFQLPSVDGKRVKRVSLHPWETMTSFIRTNSGNVYIETLE